MKKINPQLLATVSWIVTVTLTGTPLAGHGAAEIVAWGDNSSSQTNVPGGLSHVVAIAAGNRSSLALRTDGSLVRWGSTWGAPPEGLTNLLDLTAAPAYGLARVGPLPAGPPARPGATARGRAMPAAPAPTAPKVLACAALSTCSSKPNACQLSSA